MLSHDDEEGGTYFSSTIELLPFLCSCGRERTDMLSVLSDPVSCDVSEETECVEEWHQTGLKNANSCQAAKQQRHSGIPVKGKRRQKAGGKR
jgi:hypothetical protein